MGLPLVEAIHYFIESNGRLPSFDSLDRFADMLDCRLQAQPKGRPWAEILGEALAYRAELGLESPTELPNAIASRGLEIKVPDQPIPGAVRRGRHGQGRYTEEELLDALDRFDTELPARAKRTRVAYAAFAKANGLPAASTITDRLGGIPAGLERVRARRREER